MRLRPAPALLFAAAAAAYAWGLSWGVPRAARFDKVLLPEQRNDEFFASVEANRRSLYARIGENIQAAFGRGEWSGELDHGDVVGGVAVHHPGKPDPVLLHAFSAFALRAVEQDEQFALNALARFKPRKLDFNPRSSLYGGSYLYPLAGWLAALHAARIVKLSSDALTYYRDPDRIGRLYEAGRVLSILSALGSAWLLLLIGRETVGEEEALWGAALFALSPGVVAYAHLLKPHLSACFYALGCALFGLRWARAGARADALRAGLLLGLATGAAKNLAVLGPALAAAALVPGPLPWRRRLGDLASAAVLSVVVFFVTNPYTLAGWGDFLDEARGQTAWYKSSLSVPGLYGFLSSAWRAGAGAPAWALGLAGFALALSRRRGEDFRLAVFLAALLLGTSFVAGRRGDEAHSARFFFAGLGLAALLGARAALAVPGAGRWAGRAV
ncbi:MAG: glycosyltransferase family 39 protein, partial [Elusimicrobiota bacterium]|nr:glycosyltransferase family 39 protein [Elusimicrobiota bacterium]